MMILAKKLITIAKLVAKPLRMLSLYLITIAVMRPPNTWMKTVSQADHEKFFRRREGASGKLDMKVCVGVWSFVKASEEVGCDDLSRRIGRIAGTKENMDNCTFLIHKSVFEFLSTISKYTPASPLVKHAVTTATNPFVGSIFGPFPWLDVPDAAPAWTWTIPTPIVSKMSAIHFDRERERRRRTTEKNAVVRIFIWFVTWNVAASRLEIAMY
jgi:hypothetical protein